ncbi:hypothetical protein COT99_02175 [Candidatus Falkowbacteria bacterium CG10_big_fil_rev_8_21_14_0_10_43_10]|uniref:Thioredoxin domain-containing protein n=1 Tax=Candidatus Falkowbacteria bacterium CG10_big_fil_rev_8_21_14_0_10_43_10 TaxID=1974567 RepID=A0A2H0V255_9BACT|nr:MAG: hypothetical protein COT99_02175 [Candidatus Falkowbacteria bacterium CG10_big_fil_rev_8_21_14_0_10_43_10]
MLKYLKSIFFIIVIAAFLTPSIVLAQEKSKIVDIYFFYGDGCPYCAKEEKFLAQLKIDDPDVRVHYYEIWYNQKNSSLAEKIIKETGVNVSGTPITFIGADVINGYFNDETTGAEIRRLVDFHRVMGTPDFVGGIIAGKKINEIDKEQTGSDIIIYGENATSKKPRIINLPFIGQINPQKFSLFTITAAIGLIDGFNPCAMWVLLFLVSLLMQMQNRRRMWAIGLTFIIASGAVYFLFLAAWLNIFLFIGFIFWIRLAVALVAVGSGIYHLREFYVNRKGACKVIKEEKRIRIFSQVKEIISEKNFIVAMIGIIGLAAAVNMVELVCSAGLPAIYTSVLSAANLPAWQYYGYLLIYIVIFMLDDIIVFLIAMVTLRVTGAAKKYARATNLIGGIILLLIGVLLIFKPEWILLG